MRVAGFVTLGIALASTALSQELRLADFERVLVPISVESAPGAYGSSWDSVLRVNQERSARILGYELGSQPTTFPTGVTYVAPLYATQVEETAGSILYVERSAADSVHFSLRVRDLSRQNATQGVDVPVIRERDFLKRPAYLLGVPMSTDSRAMLRIYSLVSDTSAAFRVDIVPDSSGQISATQIAILHTSPRTVTAGSLTVPIRPASIDLGLRTAAAFGDTASVIVTPLSEIPFWAFVSVTNNLTQEVTLVTP
jgi:hypothetical protein